MAMTQRVGKLIRVEVLHKLGRHWRPSLEDVGHVSASDGHDPERVGKLIRVEVLHKLGRHCGPSLEDVRHVSASDGHDPGRVGKLLRVEVLHELGRHCGPILEDACTNSCATTSRRASTTRKRASAIARREGRTETSTKQVLNQMMFEPSYLLVYMQ